MSKESAMKAAETRLLHLSMADALEKRNALWEEFKQICCKPVFLPTGKISFRGPVVFSAIMSKASYPGISLESSYERCTQILKDYAEVQADPACWESDCDGAELAVGSSVVFYSTYSAIDKRLKGYSFSAKWITSKRLHERLKVITRQLISLEKHEGLQVLANAKKAVLDNIEEDNNNIEELKL